MADPQYVEARKAARHSANELADLYIAESKRLHDEHGQHGLAASITFLETLRDNLIAIRPLPKPAEPARTPVASMGSGEVDWSEEIPDGHVLVSFNEEVEVETDLALKIGETWVPKSVMPEGLSDGDYVSNWPIAAWFARREGME